ncbi:hypothetical protein ACFV9C_25175 [Kribbella sp. NPDC059898]|uniref:hypothetical protein n=1 Tax=Kribbella sp. NPDC059898 TaxID=3346995 RepID=UPI00364BF57A
MTSGGDATPGRADLYVVVVDAFDPTEAQRRVLDVFGPESEASLTAATEMATEWTSGSGFRSRYPDFADPGVEVHQLQISDELTGIRGRARRRLLRVVGKEAD